MAAYHIQLLGYTHHSVCQSSLHHNWYMKTLTFITFAYMEVSIVHKVIRSNVLACEWCCATAMLLTAAS